MTQYIRYIASQNFNFYFLTSDLNIQIDLKKKRLDKPKVYSHITMTGRLSNSHGKSATRMTWNVNTCKNNVPYALRRNYDQEKFLWVNFKQ